MAQAIASATASLETFKGHVQQTIDHIASGVHSLNEDQVFTAQSMLNGLESEWTKIKADVLEALTPEETVAETVVQKAETGAEDLGAKIVTAVEHPLATVEAAVTDVKDAVEDVVEHPIATIETVGKDVEGAAEETVKPAEAVPEEVAQKVEGFFAHLKEEVSEFIAGK